MPPDSSARPEDPGAARAGLAAGGRAILMPVLWVSAGGLAAVATALAFLVLDAGHPHAIGHLWMAMAGTGIAAVIALWFVIQRRVVDALATLAGEIGLAAHGRTGARISADRYPELGPLPAVCNELLSKLAAARDEVDQAVAASTARIAEQNDRLAAILRDLHEGVIVCNLKHQILLYNQTALTVLKWAGDLGLGRNLLQIVLGEPVLHTLDQLSLRVREGRHKDEPTAQFVAGTVDGRVLLQGQMSLILQERSETEPAVITGYVVSFSDATEELRTLGRRDALLREVSEGMRPPIANLRAMLETLVESPELDAAARGDFERAMIAEAGTLSDRLDRISAEYRDVITGSWPMSDIHSGNLISLVTLRVGARTGHTITPTGLPQWLHGDSYSLVILLDFLIEKLHEATGLTGFDLSSEASGRWVFLDIAWADPKPVPSALIDGWLKEPLPGTLGGLTAGDVLQHHRSELWSETWREGDARLRVPLPPATRPLGTSVRRQAARPEFFDFALLDQPLPTERFKRKSLAELTYAVFDCETTGLAPSEGDEIIAIAAVRIVNGRILTGETFNALINPGRPIRAESIPIHGITDDMVRDRPRAEIVLPQFAAFAADSVLVAHNAAFDLKFLKMKEASCGVRFANPVLDTMLLSLMLQGEGGDHTLDGIAARLGIQVVDRHNALGDSLLTAAIFVRMVDLMRERGVLTLEDAMRGANILMELRSREQVF